MIGTGSGSPKNLQLTTVENALIDFLIPHGLSNISEGGFENEISSNNPKDQYYSSNSLPVQEKKDFKKIHISIIRPLLLLFKKIED